LQKFHPHGIAHITGGGLPGNVVRILGKSARALIYEGTWPVHPIFHLMQQMGRISKNEMVKAFNMGIGMVLALPGNEVSHLLEWADKHGEPAYLIGQVEKGRREVKIV
jgi:phosphoribosylformylglycinamidine cyclo-ligase